MNFAGLDQMNLGLLILRLCLGLLLAYHGYNKVFGGGRIAGTAGWFGSIGFKWPVWQARLAAATEIGAGVFLALGLLTSFAAGAMVALMVVAIWVAHRSNGFFVFKPGQGWEYCASIAVTAVAVGTVGAGAGWLANEARGPAAVASAPTAGIAQGATAAWRTFVVEVAHPVEVGAAQEGHLLQWLSKRLGRPLSAPNLQPFGYRLIGGRLLPGNAEGAAAQLKEAVLQRGIALLRADAAGIAGTAHHLDMAAGVVLARLAVGIGNGCGDVKRFAHGDAGAVVSIRWLRIASNSATRVCRMSRLYSSASASCSMLFRLIPGRELMNKPDAGLEAPHPESPM